MPARVPGSRKPTDRAPADSAPADRGPADQAPTLAPKGTIPPPRRSVESLNRSVESSDGVSPGFGAASLTQRHARSGRLCDACGNERLTEIGMTLTDGTVALFSSCHRCERKSWRATDTGTLIDVTFDAVLDRTRKNR